MPFEAPEGLMNATPDATRVAETRRKLMATTAPVRALPPNAALMITCIAVFVALAAILAMPFGYYGIENMSAAGRAMEFTVLLLLAVTLAGGVVEQMIPGSQRTLRPVVSALTAIVLLSVTALLLFPVPGSGDFVRRGLPCLRLGLTCAIPAAGLVHVMMRRGLVTDDISAAVAGGAFAGLLGVAVLTLHCPIFSSGHIVAWHVGVIALTSLLGALAGWLRAR